MINKKILIVIITLLLSIVAFFTAIVTADTYYVSMNASLAKSVYGSNENISLSGTLNRGTIVSSNLTNHTTLANVNVTLNLSYYNGTIISTYILNTSTEGKFSTKSESNPNSTTLFAPNVTGSYLLILEYNDPNNTTWKQWLFFSVSQSVIDGFVVYTDEATYLPSDPFTITIESWKKVNGNKVNQANITVNGTVRSSANAITATFDCITNAVGSCIINKTASATAGSYTVEINNFSSSTTFSVIPFDVFVYTKDTTGEVFKNSFAKNNGASIEVQVSYNDSFPTGEYTFTGTITDVNSNTIKVINTTTLQSNNSYTNRFSFTLDNSFSNGFYTANVVVSKTGTSSTVSATTTFQVRSWTLFVDSRQQSSNIEYGWKSYINKTIYIDIMPLDAGNGTVISTVNTSTMSLTIRNLLDTILNTSNATWNATCRKNGCYQAALQTPAAAGTNKLIVKVDFNGEIQTFEQTLSIINEKLEATPSNENGELKELFGTNEFIYISLTSLNSSGSSVNITDVELKSITFFNGTIFTYTNVSFTGVNATNTVSEYGYNISSQLLKIDTPESGGPYFLEIYANNKTLYTTTSVIVNPYDVCAFPKNTAGQVASSSSASNYYVSQFKTDDLVYLELVVKEASNPLGKPSSGNSTNTTYGKGAGCTIDTTTQQAVNNATVTIDEVLNTESGIKTAVNTTSSVCQADNTAGKYTCTIQQVNNSWEPGRYLVRLKIAKNGVTDIDYGFFEAKAFYLYAYSNSWRNKPNQNLAFTVNMYEAGSNWWGSATGLSGTVSIERVEYCGADGFWMSSCVDINYNTTGLNSTTVTSGMGSLTMEVNRTTAKSWTAGRYQAILKATDSSGITDYGRAYFEIRLFEAWGNPISIPSSGGCNYKYSVGAKENVSLYVRITNAGDWNDNGGTILGGPVSISVKKILETSSWPPKELAASSYNATNLTVIASSPQYWSTCNSTYILNISSTSGRWNDSGYFQVVLDINGTETGNAWYQIKAFNVYTEPTNANGTTYVYNSNGRSSIYFKVYTTKGEKYYQSYTANDYINTTIQDIVLRYWDSSTMQTKELNYPEDINITVNAKTTLEINGTSIINISKKSGNWPAGYYSGDITLIDLDNQTARGNVYFNVQAFRAEVSSNQYEIAATANVIAAINIRDPDWYANSLLAGNYSVSSVYEDIWTGSSSTRTTYNYTPNVIFNASTNITIVPSNNRWSTGSWGGYHYLNIVIKDISDNTTQSGWLSLRTVPFRVTINATANIGLTANPLIPVTLQNPSDNSSVNGNLTKIYSWGSTNGYYGQKLYNFTIGACSSNTSISCLISGSANISITAPSGGWEDGYIYLTLVFTDGSNIVESYANFRATQIYTGWWNAVDESNVWSYNKGFTENASMQLNLFDSSNNPAIVNITQIEYAETPQNCWMDSCRTYVTANWTIRTGNVTCNKICYVNITNPGTWKRGEHTLRATVSGPTGTAVIKGGYFWVKDTTAPVLTITTPLNNITYNSSLTFSATTTENANCYLTLLNYDIFKSWYCWSNTTGICAAGNFNGSNYYYKTLSKDYYYFSKNNSGSGTYNYGSSGLTTGTTTHSYSFPIDMLTQDYGLQVYCYDEDWNSVNIQKAFKINITG